MSKTKEKILKLGFSLLREKGYSGFSYQDISEALGIKKASIHYHFKSKEVLALSILDYISEDLKIFESSQIDIKVEDRLDALMMHYYDIAETSLICPLSAFQIEWNNVPITVKERIREVTESEIDLLDRLIADGQSKDIYNKNFSSMAYAMMILNAYKGQLQYYRVLGRDVGTWQESDVRHLLIK